ncbi:MAG: hypothetical protein BHW65_07315 [Verrucomicrobia bacterium CAG:312_58_20]|nr:MAG: hypothetical protein BHW65_07315 [Verrucomicrobia bacterium CAG:312_58_20]
MAKWRRVERAAEDYLRVEVCFPEAVVLRKFCGGFIYRAQERQGLSGTRGIPQFRRGGGKAQLPRGQSRSAVRYFLFFLPAGP